jgi:hypothetical protein
MNINNSAWMQSPNVRMGILVMLAMLPTFVADLSVGKVTWITLCVALMGGLTTLKAFMSDPNQPPSGTTGGPALKVGAVILGFVLMFGIALPAFAQPRLRRPIVVVPAVVPATPVVVVPVQPVVIVPTISPRVVVVDPVRPIYRFRPVYLAPGAQPFYYQLVPGWNP